LFDDEDEAGSTIAFQMALQADLVRLSQPGDELIVDLSR
jgi:hypothetical protein